MVFESFKAICSLFLMPFMVSSTIAYAHSGDPRGRQILDWKTEQISQVSSFLPFNRPGYVGTKTFSGKRCMVGPLLSVNVSDQYAYDIDETVRVEVEFDMQSTATSIQLKYDRNGGIAGTKNTKLISKEGQRFYRHVFTLERARFAGRKINQFVINGDISIGTPSGTLGQSVTVCNIEIKRSHKTPNDSEYGRLSLNLVDESEKAVPARIGIYDSSGRMPLPQQQAIPVSIFSDSTRTVSVPFDRVSWPSSNRQVLYVNGSYQAKLPVGSYDLVIARGLEYRIVQKSFEIKADQETPIMVKLERWTDMPAKGWYSGDVHIHSERKSPDVNETMRIFTQAEDLNVGNLLQMDNVGGIYYPQYAWGEAGYYGEYPYTLVSGQEGPRTVPLGHSIQLNIDKPIRDPKRYYLYHEVFESTQSQGGLAGYAHGGFALEQYPYSKCSGLALDLPYNIVDFVEVLQFGVPDTDCWFDALNLGFKLSPAAGTDFPYADIPGAVRSYVETGNPFSIQAWFDGLKAGRTFVTSGPMLELTINGHGIGSELRVARGERLFIDAKAFINSDIDLLEKIELIQQGEVVATESLQKGAAELNLNHQVDAGDGSWFVVRAQGKNKNIVALSAPIYIYAADSGFCKPSVIPSIITKLKQQMQEILVSNVDGEYESWDSFSSGAKIWPENKDLLKRRIGETVKKYNEILALSDMQRCVGSKHDMVSPAIGLPYEPMKE